jgi:hypothetical protein
MSPHDYLARWAGMNHTSGSAGTRWTPPWSGGRDHPMGTQLPDVNNSYYGDMFLLTPGNILCIMTHEGWRTVSNIDPSGVTGSSEPIEVSVLDDNLFSLGD